MSEILPFMFLILPDISILGIRSVARHAWQRSDAGVGILTFSVPFWFFEVLRWLFDFLVTFSFFLQLSLFRWLYDIFCEFLTSLVTFPVAFWLFLWLFWLSKGCRWLFSVYHPHSRIPSRISVFFWQRSVIKEWWKAELQSGSTDICNTWEFEHCRWSAPSKWLAYKNFKTLRKGFKRSVEHFANSEVSNISGTLEFANSKNSAQ